MHIGYQPNESWLLTIMTRLHGSSNATLRDRMKSWGDSPVREMGFSLSTKLALLPLVVRQLEDDFHCLGEQLNDDHRVRQCVQTGSAYPVADKRLAFKVVADIDSFLFESRSAYEIVGRFLKELFQYVLDKKIDEEGIRACLELRGLDTKWIDELREKRIEFFHKTAPWVAVRIVSEQPLSFGLVIMKKDIKNFTNRNDYFHLEALRDIYQGFAASMTQLHAWINEEIEAFEKSHQGGCA
jgi:hypothetical protein